MAFKGIILACVLFLIAVVSAQGPSGTFSIRTLGATSVDVGTWTDYFIIEASENPLSTVTVTAEADSADVQFQPSRTFTFGPGVRTLSFRVKSNVVADPVDFPGGRFTISFTRTDPADQFFEGIDDLSVGFNLRQIAIDQFPSQTYVNTPSEPIQITITTASASDLSFTPNRNNTALRISPSPVVIKAGTLGASFTFITDVEVASDTLWWTITGQEVSLYAVEALNNADFPQTIPFNTVRRPVVVSSQAENVFVGPSGPNGLYFYTPIKANSTFTITPQAADLTFSPSNAIVGDNQNVFVFNYSASTPGDRDIFFSISGGGSRENYVPIEDLTYVTSVTIPKRKVTVFVPDSVRVLGNTTYMSISIPAPATNDVTVTFTAGNVQFSVNSVTFNKDNGITAHTVAIHATNYGPDVIQFVLSGTDATWYEEIGDASISIAQKGTFISDEYSFSDPLWVGVESPKIPIRASVTPFNKDGVTLTPVAPNLVFNPAKLTFSNGTEQQYFTITPLYTNTYDDNTPTSYTTTITWLASGDDYIQFEAPAPMDVQVNQRYFQTAWSSHLNTDEPSTATERHLQKTYKIWVSVNYVGKNEEVTVTPVSPFWHFKPAVLAFTEKDTRFELEATVTGLGEGRIDYVIGGKHGGLYAPLEADSSFSLNLRPLKIAAAVVSPDERTKANVYVSDNFQFPEQSPWWNLPVRCDNLCVGRWQEHNAYTFNPAIMYRAHTRSFLLRSFVLPEKELTITPHSPHVKFSPSKITIKPSSAVRRIDWHYNITESLGADQVWMFNATGAYLEANFSAEALAAGTHMVTFELTGADSHYYQRLPATPMTFNLVSRGGADDRFSKSSSSFLFPSFVVVAVAAIALVL